MHDPIIAWLLRGDASIAWQVERDLLQLPAAHYERTRRKVARTGWGARLLAQRATDGTWGRGLYNPKWTSTFYTLQLLGLLGVGPESRACVASCRMLMETGVQTSGAVRLWTRGPADTCVTGMLLTMAAQFGLQGDPRARSMLTWLLEQQMHDGGWNCRWQRTRAGSGAEHASFHTTTSVLEALRAWSTESRAAQAAERGRELMLAHRLYRSHRTGAIADSGFPALRFPYWWKFDVLRGLDYFRSVDSWDDRLSDPVQLVAGKRSRDGRWTLPRPHPGRVWFELERSAAPSRWNSLHAMRVLAWARKRAGCALASLPL